VMCSLGTGLPYFSPTYSDSTNDESADELC
jgi:hypothetical protein